jgi:endonuclease/exonuclease/phosphatase family metal-dependent hydrolase
VDFAAAAVWVLVLALTGCASSSGTRIRLPAAAPAPAWEDRSAAVPGAAGSTFTLMQMNLCLSGLASCYRKAAYPAVLEEAVSRIAQTHPDAVTFNEACGNDVALIARRAGYHVRFSRVIYGGWSLRCIRPAGRGFFGDAVLTRAPIKNSVSHAFLAQADIERRQWLCVTTRDEIDVCTAHLSQRVPGEAAANDAQCEELVALLARRAAVRTVIFGGDLNRRPPCAPGGFWILTDASARQDPGLQQVYGTAALHVPSAHVIAARRTDHDILLVRAQLTR